jgi:hypothetical protein|tara:strand:+ start:296 stop:601 length:306 start_codon:yes stop_codon:yes gene_type:complete
MRTNRINLRQYVPAIEPIGKTLTSTDKNQPTLFEGITDSINLETKKQRAKRLLSRVPIVGSLWAQRRWLEDAGITDVPAKYVTAIYNQQRRAQEAILNHSA